MAACHFCARPCASQWAVTVRNGEPPDDCWRREIVFICPRCDRLLNEAGPKGRRLKATGEWWYAGHPVGGNFDSPAAKAMRGRGEWDAEREAGPR